MPRENPLLKENLKSLSRSSSLDSFFTPGSVAIVGASETPGKLGTFVIQNMMAQGFKGAIYPVNPNLTAVFNQKCYPTVTALPKVPELSVVLIPAEKVPETLREHALKGIKNVIVMSAGFKEVGEGGAALECELVSILNSSGIRLVGPNCLGIFDNNSRIDTFFIPRELIQRPETGRVSLASQSGSFVGHLMDLAAFEHLGISRVLTYGNRADVGEIDAMYYFADDSATDVLGLYLEGVSDGRGFLMAAEYCSEKKPIIVMKTGKYESLGRAITTHTGAIAGSYAPYGVAFKKSGMIEVSTEVEFIDACKAISSLPYAKGKKVLIVSHAGGLGLTVADLCIQNGLQVNEPGKKLASKLSRGILSYASVCNPIDLTASGTDEHAEYVFNNALLDEGFADLGIYLALWGLPQSTDRIGEILSSAVKNSGKPIIIATLEGKKCMEKRAVFESKGLPVFLSIERAVKAAKHLAEVGERKTQGRKKQID